MQNRLDAGVHQGVVVYATIIRRQTAPRRSASPQSTLTGRRHSGILMTIS